MKLWTSWGIWNWFYGLFYWCSFSSFPCLVQQKPIHFIYWIIFLQLILIRVDFWFLGHFSKDVIQMETYFVKAAHLPKKQMSSRRNFLTQFCLIDHKGEARFFQSHHRKFQLPKVIWHWQGLMLSFLFVGSNKVFFLLILSLPLLLEPDPLNTYTIGR